MLGVSLFKIAKVKKNSHFNPASPGSLFYSEAAFHYRYAKIVAEAKENPFRTLKNDKLVQFPENINVLKYYTVMMEFACGFLYRIFDFGLPFNLFLIYFDCFFSSLPLIMVFLIAKRLFQKDFIALGASLFYLTTPASYVRTSGSPFLREDFALVFVLFGVWLILILLNGKMRPFLSLFTGIVVVFSLSSWHFSHFVYMCMLPFFYWVTVSRPQILKNFFYAFLVMFIAGFFVPVLKTRVFPTSILMCSLYTMLAGYFFSKRYKKISLRIAFITGIFILLIGARNIFGLYEPAYSHVFGLFFQKLRFFLRKPDNPLLLPFNARQLWEAAFNSTAPLQMWRLGKLAFPLGVIGALLLLWSERQKPNIGALLATSTLILFILSVMVKRILVVGAPFASVALWGCLINENRENYIRRISLVFLLALNFIGMNLGPIPAHYFIAPSFSELFKWINSNTKPEDAFVAHIPISPMVLLNTGRPEVLHPKFENLSIRKKYKEFITTMYSTDEEKLFNFCKKNKAEYLIYDWGFFISDNKDSIRYLGGAVPNISENALAARLHFRSPWLKHFKARYRNNAFIVYKVVEKETGLPAKKLPYSPIYDAGLFSKENGFYKNTRKTYDEIILPYADAVNKASDLIVRKKANLAIDLLQPIAKQIPRGSEAVYLLAQAYAELKQYQKAETVLEEYLSPMSIEDIALEPNGSKILELLADVQYYRGLYDKSFETLNKCLKLPSHSPLIYNKLGILETRQK